MTPPGSAIQSSHRRQSRLSGRAVRPGVAALAALAAAGVVLTLLSSCASRKAPKTPPAAQQAFQMYHWEGDGAKGSASIVIYLDQQKAYFYRGKKAVGWTYVATGKPSHPTPAGNFSIKEKSEDKISNLYGKLLDANGNVLNSDFNLMKETLPEGAQFKPARMPYYMRLKDDGVGMHAGPIPRPGSTASHGCIRMPREMAVKFFHHVGIGTPVTILAATPQQEQPGGASGRDVKTRSRRDSSGSRSSQSRS